MPMGSNGFVQKQVWKAPAPNPVKSLLVNWLPLATELKSCTKGVTAAAALAAI